MKARVKIACEVARLHDDCTREWSELAQYLFCFENMTVFAASWRPSIYDKVAGRAFNIDIVMRSSTEDSMMMYLDVHLDSTDRNNVEDCQHNEDGPDDDAPDVALPGTQPAP